MMIITRRGRVIDDDDEMVIFVFGGPGTNRGNPLGAAERRRTEGTVQDVRSARGAHEEPRSARNGRQGMEQGEARPAREGARKQGPHRGTPSKQQRVSLVKQAAGGARQRTSDEKSFTDTTFTDTIFTDTTFVQKKLHLKLF